MKVQELQAKVDNAAANVEKRKATIARHKAQKEKKLAALVKQGVDVSDLQAAKDKARAEGNNELVWAIYDVESKDDDIVRATHKLKEAERILNDWQEKLSIEMEKERFLSEQAPPVIVEFLEMWKEQARDWYIKAYARYIELKSELEKAKEEAKERFLKENPEARAWGRAYDRYLKEDEKYRSISQDIAALGGHVATMASYYTEEERLAWLERMLEEERRTKLYDLIQRINEVVGSILDASHLRVSDKGNLDGIIVGEKGKAKIETIGAGGYNIQCFHYRTLVHLLK